MILKIISVLGTVILLLNFILYLSKYSKQEKAFKIFTVYLLAMLISQIAANIFQWLSKNNLFISHFYFIVQFLLLSYFYWEILTSKLQKRVVMIVVPIGLMLLGVQYFLEPELFFKFNLLEIFITSFSIIVFAMFHFYNILNEQKNYFYINVGIFTYLFASTILFISGNLLNSLNNNFGHAIWIVNSVIYVISQLYILKEFKHLFGKREGV